MIEHKIYIVFRWERRMLENKRLRILTIIMVVVFSITFTFGVFGNPNFNIYDFCMNLASEIIGMVIALILVDAYVKEKQKKS